MPTTNQFLCPHCGNVMDRNARPDRMTFRDYVVLVCPRCHKAFGSYAAKD